MALQRAIGFLAAATALMPVTAFGMTINTLLGYLDIFVGLFLAVSIIMFVGALITYFSRYGTPRRADAFPFMEWSITIVFVLIVILALVHFLRDHTKITLFILAVIIFLFIAKFVMSVLKESAKKEEKPPGPPAPVPVVRP